MRSVRTTQLKMARKPTARQLATILVADETAGTRSSAQVNSAVFGRSYAEFGDFVMKETIADQWANPDRFVVKLGVLRRSGKRETGPQK